MINYKDFKKAQAKRTTKEKVTVGKGKGKYSYKYKSPILKAGSPKLKAKVA